MKRFLLPLLICPACLPREHPLELSSPGGAAEDIMEGTLSCRKCRRRYPIREGVAVLLPEPDEGPSGGQWKYEEAATVNSYLWSHFADLMGDPDAGTAYGDWAECLAAGIVRAFDAGCAVGRLTFEMAQRSEVAVGCDLSLSFVRTARRLAASGRIDFSLPLEGNLREEFHVELPGHWRTDRAEFVVADALRIPFARESFNQTASLNLVDRVRHPLAHLYEINRVSTASGATFLFSDPFSWSTANSPEEAWLGGTTEGPYAGRGIDNIRSILEGRDGIIAPPWRVERDGSVAWKLRSHHNHFELVRSRYLVAAR
jgi:uncharacterized protein YbaR (Trm112 family)